MKLIRVESRRVAVPLKRPYAIAGRFTEAVEILYLRLVTDSVLVGLGAASPAEDITGESYGECEQALAQRAPGLLVGRDPLALTERLEDLAAGLLATPAARAALDMALHDLVAKSRGLPLVEHLGRRHPGLPTSVTLGIQSTEDSLAEAAEHLAQGFTCLKVKIGEDLAADLERLGRLRDAVGERIRIRVDANQGYGADETRAFFEGSRGLDLEFVEQPMGACDERALRALPAALRDAIALDESLHGEADARRLVTPPRAGGLFVIKLMKSGGIAPALDIAGIAADSGTRLMWGCMDESRLSIAAALHAACACEATRYLDLDGSFDLSADLARGGFRLVDGVLELLDRPGLGVECEL